MIGGVWRRLRQLFEADTPESGTPTFAKQPTPVRPNGPRSVGHHPGPSALEVEKEIRQETDSSEGSPPVAASARVELPETPPSPPAAAVEPGEAPRSIESLVESYSNRLTEDETLRGNLADDEFEPLLSWAFDQLQHLATRCVALPDAEAAHRFERGALQIVDLLRLIDVALEDRSLSPPVVVASRLEMLDTCLAPPLLDEELAARARSRLSNLLTSPPEELQRLDRAALIDQVLAVLR